jgi:microcystin degradation protein MlrC
MRRVALLGIFHETNTFLTTVPADYSTFSGTSDAAPGGLILRRGEVLEQFAGSNFTISGYIDAASELGFELVPLMFATTGPIGTVTKDAYDRLTAEMFGMLASDGSFDGVILCNHGAGSSEEFPDMEGAFCAAVRDIVGPSVPIAVAPDMHANISETFIESCSIVVVWRTNPHVDAYERAVKAAHLLQRTMSGEIEPVMHLEKPPLVVSIVKQFTGAYPTRPFSSTALLSIQRGAPP